MSEWTEARIAYLRKRWGQGATASTIARELNEKFGGFVSRNAVIGKSARIGLTGRASPKSRDPAATAAKRQRTIAGNRQHGGAAKRVAAVREASLRPAPLPAQSAAPIAVKPVSRPIPAPIAKKASPFRTCQYLHGEAKLRNFCGAPAAPGHSWCEAHYIACHQKPQQPSAADQEAA